MDARLDKGPRSVFTPATKPVDDESEDWRLRPAMEARFGSKLRMTVDEETAWLSLTGSHSRVSSRTHNPMLKLTLLSSKPNKITPFVYASTLR